MAKTVCILDDDDLYRAHLSLSLRARGHAVVEAGDTGTALRRADAAQADVVMIDMLMPDIDGLEAMRAFKTAHRDIRIIAMSAGGRVGGEAYLEMASRFGAHATFLKPGDIAAMIRLIEDENAAC